MLSLALISTGCSGNNSSATPHPSSPATVRAATSGGVVRKVYPTQHSLWRYERTASDIYGNSEAVYALDATSGRGELDVFCVGKKAAAQINKLPVLASYPENMDGSRQYYYAFFRFGVGRVRRLTCDLKDNLRGLTNCRDPNPASRRSAHTTGDWLAQRVLAGPPLMRLQWKAWAGGWRVSSFPTEGLRSTMASHAACD